MNRLRAVYDNFPVYNAGFPHFLRNFSRDSFVSGILSKNAPFLKEQLEFSALKQGHIKNPYTGEEPGKIHHEYPGVEISNYSTLYNACDTTSLFLIGHRYYKELTSDTSLGSCQRKNIESAVEYIVSHIEQKLFKESPYNSGADKFALKVTYWKDSELQQRENGEPVYPVVYPLAHVLSLSGIRSAAVILDSHELKVLNEELAQVLPLLFDTELGGFYLAIDKLGQIKGLSSDSLHALFYLDHGDLTIEQLDSIIESSKAIETPIGYRTLDPNASKSSSDQYHTSTVWPFEQAIIHSGAIKLGLKDIARVCENIMGRLQNSDTEFFNVKDNGEITSGGCNPQLWTIAAKRYFLSQG